jgi:general stress protein YciG
MEYEEKGTGSTAGAPRKDGKNGEEAAPRRAMTVSEAGRKGGITVRDERGHAFYEEIGRKGGQKVRELIERGKTRT